MLEQLTERGTNIDNRVGPDSLILCADPFWDRTDRLQEWVYKLFGL